MAYFAALLARTEDAWESADIDLDPVDDLDSLAEVMRQSAVDDNTVLLFVEHEDHWFAVVRVDGDDDPRVFVSDGAAVRNSAYAEMLLASDDETVDQLAEIPDVDAVDEEEAAAEPIGGPAGDAALLTDLGVDDDELLELSTREGLLPTDALTLIAEHVGAADALESVR